MVSAGRVDWDAGWFVDYEEAGFGVVVDYFDGTGGDGGFMTMNGMRNTIAILNFVCLVNDIAVYSDCPFCNRRFIILRLSVSKL